MVKKVIFCFKKISDKGIPRLAFNVTHKHVYPRKMSAKT